MSKTKTALLCVACVLLTLGGVFSTDYFFHRRSLETSLSVNVPASVKPGDIVNCAANLNNPSWWTSTTVYQWKVFGPSGDIVPVTISDQNILFPAGAGGRFDVICSAVSTYNYFVRSFTEPVDIQHYVVTVGTPTPPTPIPSPLAKTFWVVGLFDTTSLQNLPVGQQSIYSSTTLGAAIKDIGGRWLKFDINDPHQQSTDWMQAGKKNTIPAVVIVQSDGSVFKVLPLPTAESDLVATVKNLQ